MAKKISTMNQGSHFFINRKIKETPCIKFRKLYEKRCPHFLPEIEELDGTYSPSGCIYTAVYVCVLYKKNATVIYK